MYWLFKLVGDRSHNLCYVIEELCYSNGQNDSELPDKENFWVWFGNEYYGLRNTNQDPITVC